MGFEYETTILFPPVIAALVMSGAMLSTKKSAPVVGALVITLPARSVAAPSATVVVPFPVPTVCVNV